ncbi:MAG: hypothetical protein K5792_09895 [Butyrivibrio sp.]|nr:hypothetical protein [Butyrivibrio sp.]
MFNFKKITTLALTSFMTLSLLTGCTNNDKAAVTETAENFLNIVTSGSTDNIEQYASNEVSEGSFVKTFDSTYLSEELKSGFVTDEIDEEATQKVDELCALISDMITSYEISDTTVNKDGTATVVAIINTSFPIDLIESDEALDKIEEEVETYYTDNAEEITALYADNTEEEVEKIIYNDMIIEIANVYEELINSAEDESYAIVLTLTKNTETDSWYVSAVSSYDNATSGTTEAATETATTAAASASSSDSAEESASESSTN